jgi:hypothetical protein
VSTDQPTGPFLPEFAGPAEYLDWLLGFAARRRRRIADLELAIANGNEGALVELRMRSKAESQKARPQPWAGPSDVRFDELRNHYEVCESLASEQVRLLARAWAQDTLDGLEPTFSAAVDRARVLSLEIDAIKPVLGAISALRSIFITLLSKHFDLNHDWRSIGEDRAYRAAAWRAEAIVLGDVLWKADVDRLSRPWTSVIT